MMSFRDDGCHVTWQVEDGGGAHTFFASRTTHDTTMPPTRRGTLGLGSTPKLERRLHLRGIFDALDHDADAGVSIAELQEGLARHAEVGVLRDDDHSVAHKKRLGV
jgi:hypothetical protein